MIAVDKIRKKEIHMSIAIITGASSGIGAEFARQIYATGAVDELWLVARRGERMRALAEEIGCPAKIIEADLCTGDGIEAVRTALEECESTVGYLVNAAGFGDLGTYDELEEIEVRRMIELNITALVLITNMVIPYMERGGRIIELGSASAFMPLPAFNVYASSKAFVLNYTKALNYEIRKHGIRATCFCPIWVATEFIGKAARADRTEPKKFKPLLDCKRAVRGCMRASKRGKAVYVTNWYARLEHLLSKLLPTAVLSRIWVGMLNRDISKER